MSQVERPVEGDRYFTTEEAAEYLKMSKGFLDKARHYGGGPAFVRVSARAIRYDRADLDAWMSERRAASCADYRDEAGA